MTKRLRRAAWFVLAVGFAGAQSPPPPNDAWAAAIPVADGINPSAPAGADGALFTNVGATDSAGFGGGFRDVFFAYVATAGGTAAFSTCPAPGYPTPSATDLFVELYAATGGPPLASNVGACGAGAALSATVVAGTSYVVRVGSATGAGEGTFRLTAARAAACGDDPSGAADLGSGPAFAFAFQSPAGATPDTTSPICPTGFLAWTFGPFVGPPLADAWATFTPTVTGRLFHTNPAAPSGVASGAQPWPDLRWGIAPASGAVVACMNSNSSVVSAPLVQAGTTYLLRLAAVGAPPPVYAASFRIVASVGDCASPVAVSVGTTPISLLSAPLDTTCAPYGVRAAWYAFVAPSTGVVEVDAAAWIQSAAENAPGLADGFVAAPGPLAVTVYSGACGALLPLAGSAVGPVRFSATAGVEYRVRLTAHACANWVFPTANPGDGTLTLAYGVAVAGDDCTTPLAFLNGESVGPTTGATFGGTPFAACGPAYQTGLADLWHVFVAPTSGPYRLFGAVAGIEVYAGSCGGVPIACGAGIPVPFDAIAGASYFVRVATTGPRGSAGGAPPPSTYLLSAAPAAPNDGCAGALPLAHGDNPATGWFDLSVATASPAPYACYAPGNAPPSWSPSATWVPLDLFYSYVPDFTDVAAVQAYLPSGTSYYGLSLFVYDAAACAAGGAPTMCGTLGRVEFAAVAGTTYVIRAATNFGGGEPFALRAGRAFRTLASPSSGVPAEGQLGVGAEPDPWIGGGGSWFDYGLLLVVGAPAAAPIALDVAAPGAFPPGALLHVEPFGALVIGPLPINESFYYVLPPYADPAGWGFVFAVQAFFAGYAPGGAPLLRPSNGVFAVTGV